MFALKTYALQLQDIDRDNYKGQNFSIRLEDFEDVLSSDTKLPGFSTALELLDNTSAVLYLPESLVQGCQHTPSDVHLRLSVSVFLRDVLFQSLQSQNNERYIGSHIVSTRLRCAENSPTRPITAIFRTSQNVRL